MNETFYELEGMYRRAVSVYAIADFEINVTQNLMTAFNVRDPDLFYPVPFLEVSGSLKAHAEYLASRILTGNAAEFRRLLDPDNLLQLYTEGIRDHAIEFRIAGRSGRKVWLRARILLTKNRTTGDILGIITLRNITARKKTETENKRRLDMIEGLTREFTNAYSVDLRHDSYEVFRMNRVFREQYSAALQPSYSESVEAFAREAVYSHDREDFLRYTSLDYMEKVLSEQDEFSFTFRVMQEDGLRYFRGKYVRIGDPQAPVREAIAGYADIHREREEEIHKQKLLEDALERARKADNAKSAFLSNMSHDIRTPMTSILGLCYLAQEHAEDPEKVRDCLAKINTSGTHLLQLIGDILDMTRIESGRLDLDEEWYDLRGMLRDSLEMLRPLAMEKEIRLELSVREDVPTLCFCDRVRLTQLLVNLLSNAVKYTNPGGHVSLLAAPGLRPMLAEDPEEGLLELPELERGLLLQVQDDGIGMEESFQERMFKPFEREKNSTMSKVMGTGLGLSICKGIVESMKGTITVETKRGEGSTFTVWLPVPDFYGDSEYHAEEGKAPSQVSIFAREGSSGTGGRKQKDPAEVRLLLVEDNDLNREILQELLLDEGYQVEAAVNGQEAVERIAGEVDSSGKGRIDAVLMDLQMPVMDGYEATRHIRALRDRSRAGVPVIAMTADAFEEDRKRCREAEMDAYISKPVEMEGLRYVLSHIL